LDTIFFKSGAKCCLFKQKSRKTSFDYLENHKTAGRRFFDLFDIFTKSLENTFRDIMKDT